MRPLTERMVEHRRRLGVALNRRQALQSVVAGNGGKLPPRAFAEVEEKLEEASAGVARCVQAIRELGGQVKDPERGLVDFPALREGREVLLCWQLGEERVGHWHGVEEGFAGRRELPFP